MSLLLPTFLQRLSDPTIRTVLLCGCGGGFDFVHSLLFVPELLRLGKRVVIGSYSFGDPASIHDAETVFEEGEALVKRVTARSRPDPYYGPEVHVCSLLDGERPASAPQFIYAYYARAFSVPVLRKLYARWIEQHGVDAIVLVDGGSDSLMAGDEEGLGDPIEDAVSVAAVASLGGLKARVLVSVGLGSDRFNQVADAASLRAVAELTRAGGFLGAVSVEPESEGFRFYRRALAHLAERQEFRSVLASNIAAAIEGGYGPAGAEGRARGSIFLWPLMGVLWAFDIEAVARRSLIVRWIEHCATPLECVVALERGRRALGDRLRDVEELPTHVEWRGPRPR